jgi:hypothetical protein
MYFLMVFSFKLQYFYSIKSPLSKKIHSTDILDINIIIYIL